MVSEKMKEKERRASFSLCLRTTQLVAALAYLFSRQSEPFPHHQHHHRRRRAHTRLEYARIAFSAIC